MIRILWISKLFSDSYGTDDRYIRLCTRVSTCVSHYDRFTRFASTMYQFSTVTFFEKMNKIIKILVY